MIFLTLNWVFFAAHVSLRNIDLANKRHQLLSGANEFTAGNEQVKLSFGDINCEPKIKWTGES